MEDGTLTRPGDPVVTVAPLRRADYAELTELLAESADFHRPWVSYPVTPDGLSGYAAQVVSDGGLLFAARRPGDGALVGLASLSRVARGAWQTAECGCAVGVRYRGSGYMTRSLAEVVRHATGPLGLHRVEALVQPGNTASERMLRRIGFRAEGTARSAVLVHGRWLDHVRWAITADDLPAAEGGDFRDQSLARR